MVNIGKSVVIKGELSGSEDLTIEGHVEGRIDLKDNVLTIGPNGKIKAEVFAKAVVVLGEVTGNVAASVQGGVPEPASWMLMITGFGALGGVARRRRRHLSLAG